MTLVEIFLPMTFIILTTQKFPSHSIHNTFYENSNIFDNSIHTTNNSQKKIKKKKKKKKKKKTNNLYQKVTNPLTNDLSKLLLLLNLKKNYG